MGCHFLLQGIFLNQGSNPCLPPWQADSSPLSHQGSHMDSHTLNQTQGEERAEGEEQAWEQVSEEGLGNQLYRKRFVSHRLGRARQVWAPRYFPIKENRQKATVFSDTPVTQALLLAALFPSSPSFSCHCTRTPLAHCSPGFALSRRVFSHQGSITDPGTS